MQRMTTWWRNLGGLLAACVLALLVVAPTTSLAACLCVEDAAIGQVSDVPAIQAERHEEGAPCKAACCVSGHCHHAGSLLDAPVVAISAPAPMAAEHAIAPTRALASRAPSALDRPPRA
jgi:uncharacterized membrane protein YjjB (DUF3815 family)